MPALRFHPSPRNPRGCPRRRSQRRRRCRPCRASGPRDVSGRRARCRVEAVQGSRRAPGRRRAMGALGRILQAWEQWDAAHQAYERAAGAGASDVRLARISTRSCCSGWPVTMPRPSALRRALAVATGLPAGQAEARRSAARGRRARAERTAVRPADGDRRDGAGGGSRDSAASARREGGTRRPFATSSGRSRCFRSLAPRTTRWRAPTARSAAPPTPSAPPRRTPGTARAGRDSTIPCSPPSPRCARMHAPPWPRGVSLAASRRRQGRHRRARSGAGARSLADAGARQSGPAVRPSARLGRRPTSTIAPPPARAGTMRELHYDYGVVLGMQEQWEAAADAYQKGARGESAARAGAGTISGRSSSADAISTALRPNTVRRSRPGRRSAWRASTSDGCCSFAATPLRRSPSSRSSSSRSMPKRRAICLRYRQRSSARAEWLTDAGSAPEAQRLATELGQTELARAIAAELSKLK